MVEQVLCAGSTFLTGKGWQLMLAELGFELDPDLEFNPEVISVIDKCCWNVAGGGGFVGGPGRRCPESPDLSPQGTEVRSQRSRQRGQQVRRLVSTTKWPGPRGPAGTGVITLGLQSVRHGEGFRVQGAGLTELPSPLLHPRQRGRGRGRGRQAEWEQLGWAGGARGGGNPCAEARKLHETGAELLGGEPARPGVGDRTCTSSHPSASFLPHLRGRGCCFPHPTSRAGHWGAALPRPLLPLPPEDLGPAPQAPA